MSYNTSYPSSADMPFMRRTSWGAILAASAIALAVQIVLNLLGVGIGAAIVNPSNSQSAPGLAASISGAAWFIVSGLLAAFVGGYVASRLSGTISTAVGVLHGIAAWAVSTLIVVYLLTTSVGAVVGGAFNGATELLSGAGKTVQTAAVSAAPAIGNMPNPMDAIEQQIRDTGNDPQALRQAAISSVQAVLTGDPAKADEARTRAADALARAQNIPADQAKNEVAQYEQQYHQAVDAAKAKAIQAASVTAKIVSTGAFVACISLVLAIAASWIGAAWAAASNRNQY
ncbi:PhnA-like protein [Rhizobium sp. AC27/96]|uniref:PhnA-like protein n=2 Tax=Rhizobium/Agrobacterium group TaxID=227290 RepID=UPI00082764AD|nr:PhnA-like protein [Rhizobium sp. AC27/96]OCJ00240.1 PhnA-like protein [Rhizobium sp. AC27/96]